MGASLRKEETKIESPDNSSDVSMPQWRVRLVLAVVLLFLFGLVYRLVFLQVSEQEFLKNQGDLRMVRTEIDPAHRGLITDRNGEPLAVSTPVESIWLNPKYFPSLENVNLALLASLLDLREVALRKKIEASAGRQFLYLKRHMPPEQAAKVLELGIKGLYSQREYKRFYPAGEVTSHLIGFTNLDDEGQEGIELAFNDWLVGEPGSRTVIKDLQGRVIRHVRQDSEARDGKDLALSIDLRLQYLAYKALKEAVIKHRAESGSAVVMDVATGEVLAMVNQPSYNPNDRSRLKVNSLRNRAVTDSFEPGSTIKAFTVATALASGRYAASTKINTSPGYIRVGRKTIRDHANYGQLDLTGIIKKSSNVGTTKLAQNLGSDLIWSTLFRAGFGQAPGTGFPGEGNGILPMQREFRPIELATLSYGYGLAATPLQLANAYTSFGNNGFRPEVTLLARSAQDLVSIRQEKVMPERVAAQVLQMLETVTHKGGTAKRAAVPFYRVGGKTGTVHKVGRDGYQDDKYVAYFAGLAPISDPRYSVVVTINGPSGDRYYGGEVAAPVFSEVVSAAMRLNNIAPDAFDTTAMVR
ncbi:peptidoglycan D,D-transpeptidase FtsI family protein [Litoribrevibacter albus]|uniref:Peptidoglycan D,D-transpeptidase FtsI n=1 Tax=Litoribrevibacter albus TaxID=1473156 RepID=A0AA37SD37_9GAMM|nr:penicillin-binding protein 2 [Litoribrevibacter albus]GLQ33249.1 penicillin-binding protein 3 [Litoribrevibacter albus]